MSVSYKIFVVDDHPISRRGIVSLIDDEDDMDVCGEAGSVSEALDKISEESPDIVLTDINLPGRNGLELIKDVTYRHPGLPMLVISMQDEMLFAERALHAGARGYVMKQAEPENVASAIRSVLSGEIYLSREMSSRILEFAMAKGAKGGKASLSPLERLSAREFEVFQLIANAKTSTDIAELLNISRRTVDSHRATIKRKLKLEGFSEVSRYAQNWIETGEAS